MNSQNAHNIPVPAFTSINETSAPTGHHTQTPPLFTSPSSANRSRIQTTIPIAGRQPRSRRNRPCDHCRRAKSRCNIGSTGPPCSNCHEFGRSCTFDAPAPPRPKATTMDPIHETDGMSTATPEPRERRRRHSSTFSPNSPRSRSPSARLSNSYRESSTLSRTENIRSAGPVRDNRRSSVSGLNVSQVRQVSPFDHLAKSDRFDPHVLTVVLTDDLLPIANEQDGDDGNNPQVRQISQDPSRPIFVVMDPKPDNARRPVAGAVALSHIHSLLHHHPLHISPSQLYQQYNDHVNPAMPILPHGPIDSQPPMLQGSIIATSLSHSKKTRELAPPVSGMLNISTAGLGEHNLAGVASAVLDMGMRGANSSRASYLLMAKTISLAQLLGMHIDPTRWAIPRWEQQLRIRLWWMLVIHDAWMSFLNSRPAHIQAHNWSTPLPELGAVLEAGCVYASAHTDSSKAFIAMCRLGLLITKLQRSCCTLSSSRRPSKERRSELDELYRAADGLLVDWREHASGMRPRPTGISSLIVHLLGSRCMLTRIRLELEHGLGAAFEPRAEVFQPFTELVDFVGLLQEEDVDGYWLNYAGHVLSSVTSSLIRFALASPEQLNQTALGLITRFLRSLHRLQTEFNWDIAAPALRRATNMASRLRSMGEHEELVNALQGTETSPITVTHPFIDALPDTFDFTGGAENMMQVIGLEPQLGAALTDHEISTLIEDIFLNPGLSA